MPEKPLAEQLRAIQDQRPDEFTLAWWREQLAEIQKGYRGATHGVNRCLAEYSDLYETVESLRKEVQNATEARAEAAAAIGALQAQVKELEGHLEKAREAFRELKNGGS